MKNATTNKLQVQKIKRQVQLLSLMVQDIISYLEVVDTKILAALDVIGAVSDEEACEPESLEAIFRGPAFKKKIRLSRDE